MGYCRVLHEKQAVGEVFEAHLILKRAWWAAILLEQAAPRERATFQAEVDRIERAHGLLARRFPNFKLLY
jgi:hypothetical protein